jgi:hypothetical protein
MRPPPFRKPPSAVLQLESSSSCFCSPGRTFYDHEAPKTTCSCRIFTLDTVFEATIEIQRCPTCLPTRRRRFIGPDLREKGLFNFNNSIIVAHELLDEYTIAYAGSETPFTAFVSLLAHRYMVSGHMFMGEDLFRSVWFSYVALQAFDDDMSCLRCGKFPETVIWDGITLAFGRKHLSSSLKPPTETSPASLVRSNIRNRPKQQLLQDKKLRDQLRQVIKGSSGILSDDEPSGEDTDSTNNVKYDEVHSRKIVAHLDRIQHVYVGLRNECVALATLFLNMYGTVAFTSKKPVPSAYRSFFLQVSEFPSEVLVLSDRFTDSSRGICRSNGERLIPGRPPQVFGQS